MKRQILFVIIFISLSSGCIVSKDERQLKLATKEWRESPEVLHGYLDGVYGSSILILRENGKFEAIASGMFGAFGAGAWTYASDTIYLSYVNSQMDTIEKQRFFIDKKRSKLVPPGYSEDWTQLRIMLNKLN